MSNGLKVLNAYEDLANRYTGKDFRKIVCKTLGTIREVLKEHCGPFAKYALIIREGVGTTDSNEFTKDGASIVRNIEFANPVQKHVRNMVLTVGNAIERVVGDGTTTAMLMAVTFLETSLGHLYDDEHNQSLSFLPSDLITSFDEFSRDLKEQVAAFECNQQEFYDKFPNRPKNEVNAAIAKLQALVSSKGDLELANAIYDLFLYSHDTNLTFLRVRQETHETSTRFKVEKKPFDYALPMCILNSRSATKNYRMGTELYLEKADILIIGDGLHEMHPELDTLKKYLKEYPEEKPLLVIAPGSSLTLIQKTIEDNNARRVAKIYPINRNFYSSISHRDVEFEGFAAYAGKGMFATNTVNIDECLISDVKVHLRSTQLQLTNVLKDIEGKVTHPYYQNEDAPEFYKVFEEQLRNYLEETKNAYGLDNEAIERFELFSSIYSQLVSLANPTLVVGGDLHEVLANKSVVDDVIHATLSCLNDGFYVSSLTALYFAAHELCAHKYLLCTRNHQEIFKTWFADAFLKSVYDVISTVAMGEPHEMHGQAPSKYDFKDITTAVSLRRKYDYDSDSGHWYTAIIDAPSGNLMQVLTNIMEDPHCEVDAYPPMQPISFTSEYLRRVRDLIIRIMCTANVMIPNGVYDTRNGEKNGITD